MKGKRDKTEASNVQNRIYETAICFARMWGVMETLEEIPNMGFKEVRDYVVEMAQQYNEEGGRDMVQFFEKRTKEIRKGKCSNPEGIRYTGGS